MASLHGSYFPKPKNVVCRVTVGVMTACPRCSAWMAAVNDLDRACGTCGTTLTLNAEEVSWVIYEKRSSEVSLRTAV